MLSKTKEFIADFEKKIAEENLSEKYIVDFDETIIGDSVFLHKVIIERKKSGGRNYNAVISWMRAYGSYKPFSIGDGNIPFLVFIVNRKTCRDLITQESPILPKAEKVLRETLYRLLLSSDTGYISIELFCRIMDALIYWWTTTRPGVGCLLISDNFPIHKSSNIIDNAKANGIHIMNIIAGSSHWFQIHDQFPFAELKKKMISDFYDVLALPLLDLKLL